MLPRVNGFEVLRELKEHDPAALARVVVLTAVSDRMLGGFNDGRLVCRVMRKPFDLAELIDVVLSCATRAGDGEVHAFLGERSGV